MEEADWKGILFSMGMLVLECKTDGSLAVVGDVPQWCDGSELHFGSRGTSAFLDSFLTDAEKFWNEKTGNRFRSGIWIEHEPSGLEYQLEAFALSTAKKKISYHPTRASRRPAITDPESQGEKSG